MFNRDALDTIGNYLKEKKETIAVAESVTSGALQLALSTILEASQFYQGGITAYNLGQKFKHLEVEPIHAEQVNSVSEKVAAEMAIGVSRQFNSNWGIGITGYASPIPEGANKIFAFYAIALGTAIKSAGKIEPAPNDPFNIQVKFANDVLGKLAALL